jgi:hypothetical protein
MATFNYNSFKKISGAGLVDGTIADADVVAGAITDVKIVALNITGAKIGASQVTTAKLAGTTVPAAAMAVSAVDISGAKATGTLPVARGGTNLSTMTANQALMVNNAGTALEYGSSGLISCSVFTSGGTWTRPANCTRVKIQLVGSGGGGTGHGEAGGSGGYAERYLDVTAIASVSVTIGGAGGGVNYHNVGGAGAAVSFGPYLSASGGEGARNVGGHTGGRPGIGSGGTINLYGAGGSGHTHYGGGQGGRSFFGGPSIGVHHESPATAAFQDWAAPGAGGTGGANARHIGANGRTGIVIVWNFR